VLACSTPSDAFEVGYEAVRIATKHMVPVVVLSDGYIANGSEPWRLPDVDALPPIEVTFEPEGQPDQKFQPYRRDPKTLARPWARPGTKGLVHRIGGLEKQDVTGNISYDPDNHQHMIDTRAWRTLLASPYRLKWRGGLAVHFDTLVELGLLPEEDLHKENGNAAAVYACALSSLLESRTISYGELTYFGDTRYNAPGRALLRVLESAADSVFRSRLKMPADVYEGPAMNHSYHEMIIGYGRGFSTVLLAEKQESLKRLKYTADYHRAQWLATQRALTQRRRAVAAITIRDLSEASRRTLKEFFAEVNKRLPRRRA
jgi:hypothetical protein